MEETPDTITLSAPEGTEAGNVVYIGTMAYPLVTRDGMLVVEGVSPTHVTTLQAAGYESR